MNSNDTEENRDFNRMIYAIEAGLSVDATWAEISAASRGNLVPKYDQIPEKDIWIHPLSGIRIEGTRILMDLTKLLATDVFASQDGTWKACGVEGVRFRPFSGTIWVRPK